MPFVVAFLVALAVFMGWELLRSGCPGGSIVADEQQCAATFGQELCRRAMAEGLAKARKAGGSFPTQAACLDHYPVCIERSDILAWTQKPTGYCIVRGGDGEAARIEPVYAIR